MAVRPAMRGETEMGLRKHAVLARTTGWLAMVLLATFVGRVEGAAAVSPGNAGEPSPIVPLTRPFEVASVPAGVPDLSEPSGAIVRPAEIPAARPGDRANPRSHVAGLEFTRSYGFFRHMRTGQLLGANGAARSAPGLSAARYTTWQVNERLTLHTGPSPGTRSGPGAQSVYAIAPGWDWAVGFRYERNRHHTFSRIDAPGDVAATEGLPVFSTLRFGSRDAFVALIAGAEFRGKLRVEDEIGGRISVRSDRPSAFAGVAGRVSF